MKTALVIAAVASLATSTAAGSPANLAINSTEAAARALQSSIIPFAEVHQLCGADIVGKDINNRPKANAMGCFQDCATERAKAGTPFFQCSSVTWTNYQGGTCYAKSTNEQTSATVPNAAAESYMYLITGGNSVWSSTKSGFDMPGYDIATAKGSMDDCKKACIANRNCFAVTRTDFEGGTCWLKRRASAWVAVAGAESAYMARYVGYTADRLYPCP